MESVIPELELVAELPVPAECVRRIRWLIGDIGLRAESVVASALDEDGQRVEAWEPSCVQVVVNVTLRVSPADAEVATAALEWAGLVTVTSRSKGHAGTSGKAAADDDQALRNFYLAGTIVRALPEPCDKPPIAAGEPVMGWVMVPEIKTRIAAGTRSRSAREAAVRQPARDQAVQVLVRSARADAC